MSRTPGKRIPRLLAHVHARAVGPAGQPNGQWGFSLRYIYPLYDKTKFRKGMTFGYVCA